MSISRWLLKPQPGPSVLRLFTRQVAADIKNRVNYEKKVHSLKNETNQLSTQWRELVICMPRNGENFLQAPQATAFSQMTHGAK